MPGEPAYVIVGASLAGAKAAETLREEGFDGTIALIGQETERPYERPPLSKGFLLGKAAKSSIYVHEEAWYAAHRVNLLLGSAVTAIDRTGRRVELADGSAIPYDRLLLTTGASPRTLDVPGGDLGGVRYLRTVADSERLGAALAEAGQVIVVGAGWIGLEVAAAAREQGCEVTVVEPEPGALLRSIGPELGGMFADLHRAHGVTFRFGESVTELRGSAGRGAGGGQRGDRGCRPAYLRPGHLRGRGRGLRVQPAAGAPGPGRALGQCPQRRAGRGAVHAGPGGLLRPGAVLLQRPVRAGYGGGRAARAGHVRPGGLPGGPGGPGIHRILAGQRGRCGWNERQRLGRDRRHPGADPVRAEGGHRAPHRP